jgi:hypothetical protein
VRVYMFIRGGRGGGIYTCVNVERSGGRSVYVCVCVERGGGGGG